MRTRKKLEIVRNTKVKTVNPAIGGGMESSKESSPEGMTFEADVSERKIEIKRPYLVKRTSGSVTQIRN